ncbi:MAG: DinB family protein [Candidatus Hydrogenedentes bacterium]|nr:DinB family protein [Candidatus Hydrogenedentota bacterium]
MDHPKIEVYRQLVSMCRQETLGVAGRVHEQHRYFQLREGKAHPLWLLGHLANTLNVVLLQWTLGKESIFPKTFGKMFAPDFAGGAPVTSDPSAYPTWDEVTASYDQASQHALEACAALEDSELPAPPRGDFPDLLKAHFPTIESALARMIGHDNYHRGQMALLSKLNK